MTILNSKLYDHKLTGINVFYHMARVINSHMKPGCGDFFDDRQMLLVASKEARMTEDRLFLWMCTRFETFCLPMADVFTKGSSANQTFLSLAYQSDASVFLYAIEIYDYSGSGSVVGDIYPLHYREYVDKVRNDSHMAGHSALVTRYIQREIRILRHLPSINPDSYYSRLDLADLIFNRSVAS